MTINYNPPGAPPVLTEKRNLRITRPDAEGQYIIDWQSTFTAADKEVLLDRTPIPGEPKGVAWGGYAGLSLRMTKAARQWTFTDSTGQRDTKAHGKTATWVDYSGKTENDKTAGIAILNHPDNPRSPTPWYLAKPITYFSPAPLFNEPLQLKAKQSITLKYQIVVHPRKLNPQQLNTLYNNYANP